MEQLRVLRDRRIRSSRDRVRVDRSGTRTQRNLPYSKERHLVFGRVDRPPAMTTVRDVIFQQGFASVSLKRFRASYFLMDSINHAVIVTRLEDTSFTGSNTAIGAEEGTHPMASGQLIDFGASRCSPTTYTRIVDFSLFSKFHHAPGNHPHLPCYTVLREIIRNISSAARPVQPRYADPEQRHASFLVQFLIVIFANKLRRHHCL